MTERSLRRGHLLSFLTWLACVHPVDVPPGPTPEAAPLEASGIVERVRSGSLTIVQVRDTALARIAALDRVGPELRAVIAVDAAAAGGPGPLGGVPILFKDNIDVAGFPTTAGSLALAGNVPADDAFLVTRLREAGATILGKTNLSEFANFRSTRSSSGWSGVGGQTRNPYVLDRSPCGSSSGSAAAVAASYVPAAIGTETDGSILCPASVNGIVGIKPTLGLVSRDGLLPIAHSQDTAGPMARTVRDAALLLEAMAAADPRDPAHARRPADLELAYAAGLGPDALRGARIGIARELGTFAPSVDLLFEAALEDLRRLGAELVEVDLDAEGLDDDEFEVLLHEFRADLEAYFGGAHTLAELAAFNHSHPDEEMPWFAQELFDQVLAHPDDPEVYLAAVARLRDVGPARIDAALTGAGVVAIVAPTTGPAWPIDPVNGDAFSGGTSTITAVSGYPAITVPMGRVHGLPVGLTWLGTAFDEARLLRLAYAYEQGTHHRDAPQFLPTIR